MSIEDIMTSQELDQHSKIPTIKGIMNNSSFALELITN